MRAKVRLARRQSASSAVRFARSIKGYLMVEALISVAIISILAAGVAQGYAQIKRFSSGTDTQIQAAAIASSIIDQTRSQQFAFLVNNLGTHNVTIVGASPTGDAVYPRPLLRDSSLTYYSGTSATVSDLNKYIKVTNNQAVVNLSQPNGNFSININVTVNWKDSTGPHSYTLSSVMTSRGFCG